MGRTYLYEDSLPFILDPHSMDNEAGRDIDWDNVAATSIPAGTMMCELSGGKICPRSEAPGAETTIGLLAASANKNDKTGLAGHGLYVGGVVYANLLPDAGEGNFATWQEEVNAEGIGNFIWKVYADDR